MASKIVAIEHLSLDGVFQAPGRSDEDEREGFSHGGWSEPDEAPVLNEVVGNYMKGGWSMLAGTTTYRDLYDSWPVKQPQSPMTRSLTGIEKFVATRNAKLEMPWANTTPLVGEATETVARLKAKHDKTLIIFGSGELVRSLMQAQLVDEFLLMVHPLVIGEGRRLFNDEAPFAKLKLAHQTVAPTGVFVGTYALAA